VKAAHLGLERGGGGDPDLLDGGTAVRPGAPELLGVGWRRYGSRGRRIGAEQVAGGRRANVAAREADESKRGELGA
jgi:hypothetical protein